MKAAPTTLIVAALVLPAAALGQITGPDAFADWTQETPGIARKLTLTDLPPPNADESVSNFYPGSGEFPAIYRGDAFVAEHGSWNREKRTARKPTSARRPASFRG